MEAALARGTPYIRSDGPAPAFAPADRVRTRLPAVSSLVPGGHSRLPAYAAGQTGRIILSLGRHVLPDSNAHGIGESPEPLYAVAFGATLKAHGAKRPLDGREDYYAAWLEPLETLLDQAGLTGKPERDAMRAAWEAAYLATPHGSPVRLQG